MSGVLLVAVVAWSLPAQPAGAQATRTVVAVGDSLTAAVGAVDASDPNAAGRTSSSVSS